MKDAILRANARHTAEVNALLDELSAYSDSDLQRLPADGGWSAAQVVLHLIKSEGSILAYVHKKMSFGGPYERVTLGTRLRSAFLWLSMVSPFKFKAPKIIDTENLPNNMPLADLKTEWQTVRADWQRFLEELPADLEQSAVFKHPRGGRLGWAQTIAFFNVHFRRHRGQIRRALR